MVKGKAYKTIVKPANEDVEMDVWCHKVGQIRNERTRRKCKEKKECVSNRLIDVLGKRKKGRPQRMWMDSIKHDLTEKGLSDEEAQDRAAWGRQISNIDLASTWYNMLMIMMMSASIARYVYPIFNVCIVKQFIFILAAY